MQVRKVGKETAVASSPSPASMSLSRNIQARSFEVSQDEAWTHDGRTRQTVAVQIPLLRVSHQLTRSARSAATRQRPGAR